MASFTPTQGDGYAGPAPVLTPQLPEPETIALVVGYPAPSAVQIVDRLLDLDARPIVCVVPASQRAEAERAHGDARASGRLMLFEGDAARPGLGLSHTAWRILDTTEELWAVVTPAERAAGHVQDFADECPRLRKLHIVAPSDGDAGSARLAAAALRRVRRALAGRLPLRRSARKLATALSVGLASVALVAPAVRTVGPWRDLLDYDLEAAFSWDDLERDLEAGLRGAV